MNEQGISKEVILVVDDNEGIRQALKLALSVRGYDVIEASNGLEAVKIATSECPDLILMDLSMPVMDGFVAVQILRETREICEVPIVACSAHDPSTHRMPAMRVGFNEYLTKPIDSSVLDSVIDRFLKAA